MLIVNVSIDGRKECAASASDKDILKIWLQDSAAHGISLQVRGIDKRNSRELDWLTVSLSDNSNITISLVETEASDTLSKPQEHDYYPIDSVKELKDLLSDSTWKQRVYNHMDETDMQTRPAQPLKNAHYFEIFKNGERLLVAGGSRFHDCQAVLNIKSERNNKLKISASISDTGNATETVCWQPIEIDCGDMVEIRLLDDGKEDEPERTFFEGNTH